MGLFTRTKRSSTSSSAASTAPNSGITTPTAIDNLSHSPTHTSHNHSTSPTFPPIQKTPSRLALTKTLTWGKKSKEDKHRRRIESWEREDQNEWDAPTARPHGRRKLCSKKEQEVLRAFEWKVCVAGEGRESIDGGRSRSCFSGVSPGCSRMGSVDDGHVGLSSRREGSHLVRESSRSETSGEGSVVRAASEE
ncbi:hypothetical protein IFR04_010747 [Cadophora malorum]|uniref:Uncharacterized protein n=1 Tax=Cadophora malorum TaxID=108018 RepID=A0A8H7T6M4_9HELO|nr:hypothetical protein IFR04_010747 [Cadophora malorum]